MENNNSICICCGAAISGAKYCSVCGFTPKSITSADGKVIAEQLARDYIQTNFKGRVSLLCYQYNMINGKMQLAEKKYIRVCDLNQYKIGDKVPLNEAFASLPSDRAIRLNVRVSKVNKDQDYEISVIPGKVISHDKICLEFTPSLKAKFIIGSDGNTAASQEFDL